MSNEEKLNAILQAYININDFAPQDKIWESSFSNMSKSEYYQLINMLRADNHLNFSSSNGYKANIHSIGFLKNGGYAQPIKDRKQNNMVQCITLIISILTLLSTIIFGLISLLC